MKPALSPDGADVRTVRNNIASLYKGDIRKHVAEADAIVGDMLRRARDFGLATPLLSVAYCALQVHENRLARR